MPGHKVAVCFVFFPPKVNEDNMVYLIQFYLAELNSVTAGN